MLEHLMEDYGKDCELHFTADVEPYHAAFCVHAWLKHSANMNMYVKVPLYMFYRCYFNIGQPTRTNLNHQLAQVISSLTATLGFEGALNVNIAKSRKNLVLFRRTRFMLAGYAPSFPGRPTTSGSPPRGTRCTRVSPPPCTSSATSATASTWHAAWRSEATPLAGSPTPGTSAAASTARAPPLRVHGARPLPCQRGPEAACTRCHARAAQHPHFVFA